MQNMLPNGNVSAKCGCNASLLPQVHQVDWGVRLRRWSG